MNTNTTAIERSDMARSYNRLESRVPGCPGEGVTREGRRLSSEFPSMDVDLSDYE